MRPEDKEQAISEVCGRVYERIAAGGADAIEEALLEGFYHEQTRLKKEPPGPDRDRDQALWNKVREGVLSGTPATRSHLLKTVIEAHAREVVGNFDERVYKVSTRVLPAALTVLLTTPNPRRFLRNFPRLPSLKDTVIIQGQTELIQRLQKKGTVVLVPTHFSHLDSIIVGWAIDRLKMDPFSYGAGLNLFTNPLLSFFMHNLGAYKVDRKKAHRVYKDVLKTYCTVSLQMGYSNLFFPGGTRSRSGAIEEHLKKGLLGCALSAYVNNLKEGRPKPNLYIVPAALSFQLVLEAETLIEDFLKEAGKKKVIIERDESRDLKKVAGFLKELISLDSKIYLTFGRAYDPFGNLVDHDGVSRDGRGRPIDISRYALIDGEHTEEPDRDRQFTNELAACIVDELHRVNVIQSTHLTARAVWSLLLKVNPGMDLYRLLRTGGRVLRFPRPDLYDEVARLLDLVAAKAVRGEVMVDPLLKVGNEREVVEDALRHFATYHSTPVICPDHDWITPTDLNLVYYYQHRLDGYGLP